jgi:hypothetical protein
MVCARDVGRRIELSKECDDDVASSTEKNDFDDRGRSHVPPSIMQSVYGFRKDIEYVRAPVPCRRREPVKQSTSKLRVAHQRSRRQATTEVLTMVG